MQPKDLARRMLRAASMPYCTDVIPLTDGAECVIRLETAIRSFLDAEHQARWTARPSDEYLAAEERLDGARDALIVAIDWKLPAPPRMRVKAVI